MLLPLITMLAAASFSPITPAYTDVPGKDAQGAPIIIRTAPWQLDDGRWIMLEQRLRHLGGHDYEIDPEIQSPATKQFLREHCAAFGMQPSRAMGYLRGDMAVGGISCYREEELIAEPGQGPPQNDESALSNDELSGP